MKTWTNWGSVYDEAQRRLVVLLTSLDVGIWLVVFSGL